MTHNITVVRGDTWELPIWLEDALGLENLTGASIRLQIRNAARQLLLEASTANGRIQIPGPVVLAANAVAGTNTLSVLPLPGPLLGNSETKQTLKFGNVLVRLTQDAAEGETELKVEPLSAGLPSGAQAPMGLFIIRVESANMNMPPGRYNYDLEVTWPGSPATVETPLLGAFIVLEDITS
jgi:hypothetical protein